MGNTYAGESIAKKVARVRIYLRAVQMRKAAGYPEVDTALVLAGPTASEAGCLQHILRPKHVFVVDRSSEYVENFERRFRTIHVDTESVICKFVGELEDFPANRLLDFAHVDLMGNVNSSLVRNLFSVTPSMTNASVIAVTFLRGREAGENRRLVKASQAYARIQDRYTRRIVRADGGRVYPIWFYMQSSLAAGILRVPEAELNDWAQTVLPPWVIARIEKEERRVTGRVEMPEMLRLIASFSYQATVSPMGIVMAQSWTPKAKILKYQSALLGEGREAQRLVTSNIPKNAIDDLLLEADLLQDSGLSNQAIAEIFDVSAGTLAAWRAHRTSGTYGVAA